MATFTDEEYADTERIERGYKQLSGSYVPYALDPQFGTINFMISFRDRVTGEDGRGYGYRAIDGIERIKAGTVPRALSPKDILEKVSSNKFQTLTLETPGELLDYLQAQARMSPDGQAVLFVKPASSDDLMFGIALKDDVFHLICLDEGFGETIWKRSNCKAEVGSDGLDLEDRTISYTLNQVWKKVKEKSQKDSGNDIRVEVLIDSGRMDLGQIEQDFKDVSKDTLQSTDGIKSCLMITEDWVKPVFHYRENLPLSSHQQPSADYEVAENPNCVEVATALGLNVTGGVNGKLVSPKLRMLPTLEGLRDGSIISSLQILDPLHHQSLQGRVFGNEHSVSSQGKPLSGDSISETGTVVSVYGHTFFSRKTDVVDVYDLALGFTGSVDDYSSFLQSSGISTQLRRTSQVTPYSQERTDFYRSIRAAFNEHEVLVDADARFQKLEVDKMTDSALFECWNQALADRPEIIGSKFGLPGIEKIGAAQAGVVPVGSVEEMIKGQEKGFVCLRETNNSGVADRTVMIFKDGDKAFLADGRYSGCCEDLDKALNGNPNVSYSVLSYGGTDISRMTEIHQSARLTSQQTDLGNNFAPESAIR